MRGAAIAVGLASSGAARADEPPPAPAPDPTRTFADAQPKWPVLGTTVQRNHWQAGLLYLAPASVDVPILLTNPWNGQKAGTEPSGSRVGYGLDWMLGFWLKRFAFELHAGYWRLGGPDLADGDGKKQETALYRIYATPMVRYVFTNTTGVFPFAAAGAGGGYWMVDKATQLGPNGVPRTFATFAPEATGVLGLYARIRAGDTEGGRKAAFLLEVGGKVTAALRGDVFAENQVSVVPYAGLTMLLPGGGS